jgi:hypothetical protein
VTKHMRIWQSRHSTGPRDNARRHQAGDPPLPA